MMPSPDIGKVLADVAEEAERQEVQESAGTKRRHRSVRPAKEPSQVYSIRLPADVLGSVRELARRRGEAPTSMLRTWVLERLAEETGGAAPEPPHVHARPTAEPVALPTRGAARRHVYEKAGL